MREHRLVKSRAGYLALGVSCDGEREVLGIWWQETEDGKMLKREITPPDTPTER
jgi:transposase-like protein